MTAFQCPYLNAVVEFSSEREQHVSERHPDLLPGYRDRIVETLADPDEVRRSRRFVNARLFTQWYDDVRGGKHVVVVVVSAADQGRHWLITAYIARRIAEGDVEWARS